MKREHKLAIGIGISTLLVVVAIWISMSLASHEMRGRILVRDAETKDPVPLALTLFEVSRTPTEIYPLTRSGSVFTCMTDEQGSVQVPDLRDSKWASATHFRIHVLSDKYRKYVKEFPRQRFGKNGMDCRAIKVALERKEN